MFQFNTVEEALEDLKKGKLILVTDDEDRENEGDLICAAEFATTENVNFMATHAKGLICMPMGEEIIKNCRYRRWSATTPITMRRRLPYLLTMSIQPPEFQQRSVRSQQ